ncbi:ABC transporter permease [Sporosarcina sp. NCCP-2222]|uniref:ABC transporter permease n=1 Tax=Sporosarcina sp. NCCP-2222 TaxID=2935073 RepID=UPI00208B5D8F|nr:ABC transporter permease [Sporosarcina sp. NCCP-2222]GKV56166.1 ABC transporter permease [Sporosarcina sp. NCCP-2222]
MKIMNLAIANIKKSKSATTSLFLFILVAALLLNVGLMVSTQISDFFDHKNEQLKEPQVAFVMNQAMYQSAYGDYLDNYPGIQEMEIENILNMDAAKFMFGGGELTISAVLFNADDKRNIGSLQLIEKLNTSSPSDIYVPYSFKTNGGYKLGDPFSITYQAKEYEYQIAGFFETVMMGSSNLGVMKFMLPNEPYRQLANELNDRSDALMFSAVMEDKTQASVLNQDFIQEIEQSIQDEIDSYYWGLDIGLVKSVNGMTVNIIATILIAFAAIIVLISLIVIRFRVSISIEDGMTNIGVLKAIGYTSKQILSSMILQFVLITFCASIAGIALSYLLMPFFGRVISTLSGLIWIQSFDLPLNVISVFFVVLSVVIVTLLSAFRVRKILPVAALRGGIQTHSFRRNHFPLEKIKGGLHFLLAIKLMLANAKQNVMILLIMTALTFATVFSAVLYYNIASDKTAFINLFGAEPANVLVTVKPDANTDELLSNIEQMDHVRKVTIFDLITTKIDNQTVYTNVTKQYSDLENNVVYEGRQPIHENEISISWVVSNQINKGIGDTVELRVGNEAKNYLVTGLSQSIGNLGQVAAITMDGIQQLHSDYQGTSLYVYLNGISNKDFMKTVEAQYGDQLVETLDIDENVESQTGMYTDAMFAVMLMVLVITVLVVTMILYMVIKTMIIKRKKELGIMKSIGYSTIQLMNQIAVSLLPIIFTGAVLGGLLGFYFTNPMLSVLLSSAGVKRLDFIIYLPIIFMICAGIFILAYLVSMLVARRIKKISAYELITE